MLARKATNTNESTRLGSRFVDVPRVKRISSSQRHDRSVAPKQSLSAQGDLATERLQEQLEAYDERLSLLRSQLRDSIDQKLKSSIILKKEDGGKVTKDTIVQGLVTATGQGCKEVLEGSVVATKGSKSGHIWKSRWSKGGPVKSSCTLKLEYRKSSNVTIKITFADGESVPGMLLFEHAPKATAAFKPLGKVSLQKKSLKQLKHVFHLGKDVLVDRYLRVGCIGQIGEAKNHFHAVSYLFISGQAAEWNGDISDAEEERAPVLHANDVVEVHVSMDDPIQPKHTEPLINKDAQKQSSRNVWERLSGRKLSQVRKQQIVPDHAHKIVPKHVLEPERIQSVGSILSDFKLSGSEAAEMVKNIVFGNDIDFLDTISQGQVDDLLACLPTKEERKKLRSLDASTIDNDAEDFMHELIGIDNLSAKIETKWFLADFDARAAVVQDAANLVSRACGEIQNCSKLHLAIKIILNECSESLQGAKILDVGLLEDLKNTPYSSKGSLLHFVAAKLSEASGAVKVPNIAKDLPSCSAASQVTLSEIKCELKQLMDGIDEAGTAWRADEPAATSVEKRINTALAKLSSTEAVVTETEADFIESAINAGLDPSSVVESRDLFLALLTFSDELNNAHLENKFVGFLTKSKCKEAQEKVEDLSYSKEKQHNAEANLMVVKSGDKYPRESCQHLHVGAPLGNHTPISSRVSVGKLLQSTKNEQILYACSANEESCSRSRASSNGDGTFCEDDLSTPVRKLLQSSRAIIDSFDLKSLSASPVRYAKSEITIPSVQDIDEDGLCEISSPPGHRTETEGKCSESKANAEDEIVEETKSEAKQVDNTDSDECIQNADAFEITEKSNSDAARVTDGQHSDCSQQTSTSIKSKNAAHEDSEHSESSGKNVEDSIDLNLAAKLLRNAEQVRVSRSHPSLQKSVRRKSPLGLSPSHQTSLPSKSRSSRLNLSNNNKMPQRLTPEQTKAVKALGEVIRQSLPKFSSIEADKHSGLHIDTENLDLDKILSTLILNAGNTPTGPLARGVRGGNASLFDGDEAKELRRLEKERHPRLQAGRKALLEPVVPAPLGMGVTVSKTVSEGISPETIARSLHSGMRTSSMMAGSSHTGKNSVHQMLPSQHAQHSDQQRMQGMIPKRSVHDSVAWKKSLETSNHLASHKHESTRHEKSHNLPMDSIEEKVGTYEHAYPAEVPEERMIETPPHGLELGEDHYDLNHLSPMGLRRTRDDVLKSSREHAAMAADRMQLWGYNM